MYTSKIAVVTGGAQYIDKTNREAFAAQKTIVCSINVHAVLFLCDAKSSFIAGQDIIIDCGMSKMMIYHSDGGWRYSNPSS